MKVLPYALLATAAALRWLPTDFNMAYFGNDTIYPLDPQMNASWLFSMWDPAQFGQPSFYPSLVPYFSLFALFHAFGFSLGASQHLYEWLVAFAGATIVGIVSAEIASLKGANSIVLVTGGLIFLLAPCFVYLPVGWWASVGIPLIILGLKRAVRARTVMEAAVWGSVGAVANVLILNDAPNFQLQIVLCLWIVVFIGVALFAGAKPARRVIIHASAYGAVSIGALLPLVAAEVWSVFSTIAGGAATTTTRVGANGSYGDFSYTTVGSVLTLMSYYPPQWQNAFVRGFSIVLPASALFGVVFSRRNPWVLGVGAATLASVAITIGPNPPIGPVYDWFMSHAPGAVAFRTVGKIHLFVAMGYAILAPIGALHVAALLRRWFRSANALRWIDLAAAAALFAAVAFVGKPIWMGQMYRTPVAPITGPRIVPPIYARIGKYLSGKKARTLIYPESGYTEEPFPNGEYFGPSLTTYAFPRDTVYSRGGGYGNPARSPELKKLYGAIDAAIQARPRDLVSNADSIAITVNQRADITRLGSTFRVVPRAERPTSYAVTLNLHERELMRLQNSILALGVGIHGVAGLRVSIDGHVLGALAGPRISGLFPIRQLPPEASRNVVLSLSFFSRSSSPDVLVPNEVSLWAISLIDPLPDALLDELRADGIRYVFFDGASDNPNVPSLALTLSGDPRFQPVMGDSQGRELLRIRGRVHQATADGPRATLPVNAPTYANGQMHVSFLAPGARRLVIAQGYSSLWRYWVSADGSKAQPAVALSSADGAKTEIVLPRGSRFIVTGLYLPQILLILQYFVFALMIGILVAIAITGYKKRRLAAII